jgi:hypothetical protein
MKLTLAHLDFVPARTSHQPPIARKPDRAARVENFQFTQHPVVLLAGGHTAKWAAQRTAAADCASLPTPPQVTCKAANRCLFRSTHDALCSQQLLTYNSD